MVFNVDFQIAGLVILVLVAALYRKRRTVWIYTDRIFGMLIVAALMCVVFDIASIVTINYRDDVPALLNELVCKLYLFSLAMVACITLLYLLADVFRDSSNYTKVYLYISMILMLVALAYFVLPIEYHVDPVHGSIYSYGPAVLYTYAVCIVFLIISMAGMYIFRNKISHPRRNPVLVILTAFIVAACIQFANNSLLIVSFAVSVAVLLVYLFMENPIDKVDENTGLFNTGMLKTYIDRQYLMNKKFFLAAVNVRSYDVYTRTFGIANANGLMVNFAEYLKDIDNALLFRLGECRFAVAGSYENEELYDSLRSHILNVKKKSFSICNTDIALDFDICMLKDSTLLNNSEEVVYYVDAILGNTLLDNEKSGDIIIIDQKHIDDVNRCSNIEETLRWAIENDKFEVFYQPIYSIAERKFIAFEALIRLCDERGKQMYPDDFIPIAERNGMITKIDMIVLDKVCRFVNDTDPLQYGIKSIEVNLSAVQCMQNALAYELKNVLDRYGVPVEYIHYEITETAMVNSKQSLSDNMNKLIGLGSAFFLDDYGSGYANLSFLIDLPFRAVKLDKELVWSYFTTAKGKIATKFAIDMLKSLGMDIIAEGVETEEQLSEMEKFGVDYIQGYFFSEPLCETDVIEFVREAGTEVEAVV